MDNNNNITNVVLSNDKMKLLPYVNPPCKYCQNVPWLLEDGLYELIVQYEEELRENDSTALTNKEIRFYLYRYASRWIHGYLGKGNRIKLPKCVRGEILDLAPEPGGIYIGFKKVAN